MFTRRMSVAVTAVIVALVVLALLASALPAFAAPTAPGSLPTHARLLGSTPQDGSSVATATEVVLAFSEDVDDQFLQVRVEGPGGGESGGEPVVAGREVTVPLGPDLPAGEHTVTFRVVSVDGHPVASSITFTTTEQPATTSPGPSASATANTTPSTAVPTDPQPSTTASGLSPVTSPGTDPMPSDGTPGWLLPVALGTVLALLVAAGTGLARRGPGGRSDAGPGGS